MNSQQKLIQTSKDVVALLTLTQEAVKDHDLSTELPNSEQFDEYIELMMKSEDYEEVYEEACSDMMNVLTAWVIYLYKEIEESGLYSVIPNTRQIMINTDNLLLSRAIGLFDETVSTMIDLGPYNGGVDQTLENYRIYDGPKKVDLLYRMSVAYLKLIEASNKLTGFDYLQALALNIDNQSEGI